MAVLLHFHQTKGRRVKNPRTTSSGTCDGPGRSERIVAHRGVFESIGSDDTGATKSQEKKDCLDLCSMSRGILELEF